MRKKIIIKINNDDQATIRCKGVKGPDVLDTILSALIATIAKTDEAGVLPASLLRDIAINELNKAIPDKEVDHE